jgi:glycosyltransferase involved in cell wall biosynthesis
MIASLQRRAVVIRGAEWDMTPAVPRVVETLTQQGFTVSVLCWDHSGNGRAEETIDRLPIRRFLKRVPPASARLFLSWISWWAWLLRRLLAERYEIVHVMNLDALIPAVMAKVFRRFKLVYDIRDPWGMILSRHPWLVRQTFTLADRVLSRFADGILLSQGDIGECAAFFGGATARQVPATQVLNVPQKDLGGHWRTAGGRPLRINLSGHLSEKRNARTVLDAVRGRTDVVLDVVGNIRDPELQAELVALSNVVLHGRVPYGQAMELMNQADVVSIMYDAEMQVMRVSSANKMFEAMMLGKPYLASAGCFPGRVAEEFQLGWALPYGDVRALAAWIDAAVANPALLATAGERGRRVYENYFTWSRQQANLIELYRHVLGQPTQTQSVQGWQRYLGTYSTVGAG